MKSVHLTSAMSAQNIHVSLFTCRFQDLIPKLLEAGDKSHDTDSRVIEAYMLQCKAEAQEGKAGFTEFGNLNPCQ
jgi:hypothetical protein